MRLPQEKQFAGQIFSERRRKSVIILNLMGGLGNQLFEYAYARALAEEFGDKMIIINPYFSKF